MCIITDIKARQIIDSRGNPTVEVDVYTSDGIFGRAAVPSGASTGSKEAHELRDGGKFLGGKGVLKAVENVETKILPAVVGLNVLDQREIDRLMIEIDGTKNKANLGANAILAVSLALSKVAAMSAGLPLYKYLGGANAHILPCPMINVLNGGVHADNKVDFQEFLLVPAGFNTFSKSLTASLEVFYALKELLRGQGHNVNVGDEGGFAPDLSSTREALDTIIQAIEKAGYSYGKDLFIGLDPAPSEFFANGKYEMKGEGISLSPTEMADYLVKLKNDYNLYSIEDPMAENDDAGWKLITEKLGKACQLVGDDNFVTNKEYLMKGIKDHIANAILIKVNQVGSLTETLDTIEYAKRHSYNTVISHRSGETTDTTIADLAVGVNSGQIKTGSLSRSDRLAKYNRLLRIEEELGDDAEFGLSSL